MTQSNGPLTGLKVVEFVGIGPGPHATMLLADLGAEIVRIERHGSSTLNPVVDVQGTGLRWIFAATKVANFASELQAKPTF